MKRIWAKYRNSAINRFLKKHQKYVPLIFFIGGFIFDTLTLGRIDQLYDLIVLCLYMSLLSISLYFYNVADDGKWKNTWLEKYEAYFPLVIQFFFGGLSGAYVIYFSRSVSLSKTVCFFIILVTLLVANEFLKKRISNKYLQFSIYFFISFTFFAFMIPVLAKEMNMNIFLISGVVSLACTLTLIIFIYSVSPSMRAEVHLGRIIGLILSIYFSINSFYFFKLIPPVPLALEAGIVAHNVTIEDNTYIVTYEADSQDIFWRDHNLKFNYTPTEKVYIFSSIFAPTALEQSIIHRWKWYNKTQEAWEIADDIEFEITGGRNNGYRGYTYKSNIKEGEWEVEVLTKEELILGVIEFEVVVNPSVNAEKFSQKKF
ncbi:DUF2914 domain-containing protein [Confluentibacter flavum]|uniref:DUF2914 domain-containing protein n=1 Tax=Confluentibacter flavum TaxID=1909700 RepID=A0A2N3HNZ9_9FLAO|nr:DUF2914 domain-containing protein [Confluentibacter flavum]PKQ46676.1 DUF2914 domain-containing protein [Confluentibacter flavum]